MATYDISSLANNARGIAIAGGTSTLKYATSTYNYLEGGNKCETIVEKASKWINDTSIYKSLYGKVTGEEVQSKDQPSSGTKGPPDDGKTSSTGYSAFNDNYIVKKSKAVAISSVEWVENMVCLTIPATIYQLLKLIDEALKTPIRLLDLIKDMSDRILSAIENKIMTAIDCIYKNLKDLTNLLKVDFSATFDEIRYILRACPFLASAVASMLDIVCDRCEDPVDCIEEMLQKAENMANKPYNNAKEYVNKTIRSIRKAVSNFIDGIQNKIHKGVDYLIEKYIQYVYNKEIIPMMPFPGDKGPCNDTKRKYMYTIYDALILAKRWIRCIKALCSVVSDTAENELDIIMKKIDSQTAGIFSSKIEGYLKNRFNKVTGIAGVDKYNIASKNNSDNVTEMFSKIKNGIKAINDDNTKYFISNMQGDDTRKDLHSLHVPFYTQFAKDISNFGVVRALNKGKKASNKSNEIATEANTTEYERKVVEGYQLVGDTNTQIAYYNNVNTYYTTISKYESTCITRVLDTVPNTYDIDITPSFSIV